MIPIKIVNLNLAFATRPILTNFSAIIEPGEFIGIFGPNGSGKTTLLRAILGLMPISVGSIQVLNKSARRGHPEIGYVPQTRTINHTSQLSGRARVTAAINGFKWGLPIINKKQRDEIERVLTIVGARDYADEPFAQLSGGERQRLLLAQALINHPKILLLDEPLINLDPRHQDALVALVQHIRLEQNVTVLFTAHDFNPLIEVMSRVIYLARGNAAIGTVKEIVTNEKLSWLYGMPIEVIRYQKRLFVISQEKGEIVTDVAHCYPDSENV